MTRRSEAGQTLALVAICMVTFLAAAGLAVDMGYMRYEKRLMQSAADSAALIAATDANLGESGSAAADAQAVATANGFQNGVNSVVVSITNPGNVTLGTAYQVTIQQTLPTFFMQIENILTSTVSASGEATIGTSPGCIYALQTGGAGLTLNAGINAPNCGIVDNGPLNGVGDIGAASIGVYVPGGGYGGVATIAPVLNIAQPAADPLAYMSPPPTAPCTMLGPINATSGPLMNGVVELGPGTYCGILIDTGGIVTFDSGIYNLTQTGLTIQNTGTATGAGVTFYNGPSSTAITFSGTGSITLSAPTSAGTLPANILFYQDPGNPSAADLSEGGSPSANVTLIGTLYFPNAPLTIVGSLNPNQNSLVVAQSVTVAGTLQLNADSTSPALAPGGSPLVNVSLVE
ncbi:MAG TPA: pilus assembly protein TadG-related protein [Verrucomicrobiae bacterium]|nr:pilus assembly protein TadG-related protein [Verrucomicrobiae bacterium]